MMRVTKNVAGIDTYDSMAPLIIKVADDNTISCKSIDRVGKISFRDMVEFIKWEFGLDQSTIVSKYNIWRVKD